MSGKPQSIFYDLRCRGGFTLIELLVVIAIIGILATIAVPIFLGQRTKAMRGEAMTNLESIRLLEEQYFAENGEYSAGAGACGADQTANVAAIQGELPAFKPGAAQSLYFSYCITQNKAINTADMMGALVDSDPCFTARAFGNTGISVEGQELRVDCNNVKNY